MKKNKIILILILLVVSAGFIAYFLLKKKPDYDDSKATKTYPEEITDIVEQIKADPGWYAAVKERARLDESMTLQERLILEAEFTIKRT